MKFNAFWVEKTENGFERSIIEREVDDLPEGDVLVDVAYSSLNYKDGLSASGSPGVTRNYPHTPVSMLQGLSLRVPVQSFLREMKL